jgi:chromosome segregation ATPase
MAQLEVEIGHAKRAISDLTRQLVEQERLLKGLESWLDRLGTDSEQGRQSRRAVEAEIVRKRETVDVIKQLLDNQLQRLHRLEEQLRRRPQGVRPG